MIFKLVAILVVTTIVTAFPLTKDKIDGTDRKVTCTVVEQGLDLPNGVLCIRVSESEEVDDGNIDFFCRQPNLKVLKKLKERLGKERPDVSDLANIKEKIVHEVKENEDRPDPIICRLDSDEDLENLPRGLACKKSEAGNSYECRSLRRGGRPNRRPRVDIEDLVDTIDKEDMTRPAIRPRPDIGRPREGNSIYDRTGEASEMKRSLENELEGEAQRSSVGERQGQRKGAENRRPVNERPQGERSGGDGERPEGRRPTGKRPEGRRPNGEHQSEHTDTPNGKRLEGLQPIREHLNKIRQGQDKLHKDDLIELFLS